MKYNLVKMFEVQRELNLKIKSTQHLSDNDTRIKSHLCIMVELMELCNETRCFNYWSKKQRNTDDVILEEFADVLCFLFTDLLYHPIEFVEIDENIKIESKEQITNRFLELCLLYSELNIYNISTYNIFIIKLFELGFALGYSIDQINEAYNKKINKNHIIQDSFND